MLFKNNANYTKENTFIVAFNQSYSGATYTIRQSTLKPKNVLFIIYK